MKLCRAISESVAYVVGIDLEPGGDLEYLTEINAEIQAARRNTPCGVTRVIYIVPDGVVDSHPGSGDEIVISDGRGISISITGTKGADVDGNCCSEGNQKDSDGRCCEVDSDPDGDLPKCSPSAGTPGFIDPFLPIKPPIDLPGY